MPQSQVSEVDVLRESVRHNEKGIDSLTDDFKEFRKEIGEFRKEVNTRFETVNTKFEAINNKFVTLYAMITVSILIPIGIAILPAVTNR